VQLLCELQRGWEHKETVPAFMDLFIETGGTAGIQFSYDRESDDAGVIKESRR
jgi:hypothetical protein